MRIVACIVEICRTDLEVSTDTLQRSAVATCFTLESSKEIRSVDDEDAVLWWCIWEHECHVG